MNTNIILNIIVFSLCFFSISSTGSSKIPDSLQSETVVKEDGKILHMKAGDSIVELVNQWHYGKNEGTDTAEIVVFYAGKVGTPITIKK